MRYLSLNLEEVTEHLAELSPAVTCKAELMNDKFKYSTDKIFKQYIEVHCEIFLLLLEKCKKVQKIGRQTVKKKSGLNELSNSHPVQWAGC